MPTIRGRNTGRKRSNPEKRSKKRDQSKPLLIRVEENDPTLSVVRLNYKRIGVGVGGNTDPALISLVKALTKNTYVTKLELGGNSVGNTDICRNEYCGYMSEPCFACTGINELFASSLASHRSIRQVYLWNNNIKCWGAIHLSKALCMNTALKKLDLSLNDISDAGAAALADALKHNNTLEELNLYGNDISDVGCRAFMDVFQSKQNLTLVKLSIGGQRRWHCSGNYSLLIKAEMVSRHSDSLRQGELQKCPRLFPAALSKFGACCSLGTVFALVKDNPDLIGAQQIIR